MKFNKDKFESAIEAKSYIASMDLFSGARMHATIAATSSGVPVIPVAYSRKFNGLYDTLKYKYYIDAKADITLEEALAMFDEYANDLENLKISLNNARDIYTENLLNYKKTLINVMHLKNK